MLVRISRRRRVGCLVYVESSQVIGSVVCWRAVARLWPVNASDPEMKDCCQRTRVVRVEVAATPETERLASEISFSEPA